MADSNVRLPVWLDTEFRLDNPVEQPQGKSPY
jgi:hypothetical protein